MCSKPRRVVSTRRHEPLFQTRYTSLGHTLDTRGTGRKTEARRLGKIAADGMMDGAVWNELEAKRNRLRELSTY